MTVTTISLGECIATAIASHPRLAGELAAIRDAATLDEKQARFLALHSDHHADLTDGEKIMLNGLRRYLALSSP